MIHREEHTLPTSAGRSDRPHAAIALIVILVGIALVAFGVAGGAFDDVWQRAAMVCYECIGIG